MNCPHCNDHIDTHPASRCLDAWVAEAVLEFKPGGEAPLANDVWYYPPYEHGCIGLLEYSTSIAAAFEMVEKLKENDFWFSLVYKSAIFSNDLNKAGWSAQFRCVRGGTRGDHFGVSVDPAHAISRAAIKAVQK